jgi:site-specific DNA recombinase
MKKIVAYCRSALEQQATPSSVHRQLSTIKRYAARRKLRLHAVYADAGVSGMTLARAQPSQLLADCNTGNINTVITKDPDRLSRDTRQLIALLHLFRKAGVRVEFTSREGKHHYTSLRLYLSALLEIAKHPGHRAATISSLPDRSIWEQGLAV